MTPEERFVAAELARANLYDYARWMFLNRRGYKWQRAAHHRVVCQALERVYLGQSKRIIINIPPRYSKCFPSDTLVATMGGYREIGAMKIGDEIASFDPRGAGLCAE